MAKGNIWLMYPDDDEMQMEYLQNLCEDGEFDGAVLGVTKQRIAQGYHSLSPRQRNIYDVAVKPYLDSAEDCSECGHLMPASEMSICKACFDYKVAHDD